MDLKAILTGSILFFYLFVTINIGVVYLSLTYLLLLIPNRGRNLFLKAQTWIQETYLSQIVYIIERHPNLTIEYYGDTVPIGEAALVLPNHQNHDYLILYSLALRKCVLGTVRTFLKSVTLWVPGFGATMWLSNWPFLSRSWERDQTYLHKLFETYKRDKLPLWLWLFPEGTRITPKKLAESQAVAKEKGYPVYRHVLLPRYKGFVSAIRLLSGVITSVYDVTIAYNGWDEFPGPFDILFLKGDQRFRFLIHVKRYPITKFSNMSDEQLKEWLLKSFQQKDDTLNYLQNRGIFPGPVSTLPPLPGVGPSTRTLYGSASYFLVGFLFWFINFVIVLWTLSCWLF